MPVMLKPKPISKSQRLLLLKKRIDEKKSKLRVYIRQHNKIKASIAGLKTRSAKDQAKIRVANYKNSALKLSDEIRKLEARYKSIKSDK